MKLTPRPWQVGLGWATRFRACFQKLSGRRTTDEKAVMVCSAGSNKADSRRLLAERMSTPRAARGRWVQRWDPEDDRFWQSTGKNIARRNLALSMFAEHVGFAIWVVWTVVVLNLPNAGINLPVSDLFILTLLPNLVGSLLRIPYTFAVPRWGGRAWTTSSAALLLLPALLLALVVPSHWLATQPHSTQIWALALCAASAGVGGGNFASSMANISYFYPERKKGWALGLNAAGGNIGVATSQLLVPLAVIIGVPAAAVKLARHPVHLAYAGYMWIPFIILAAVGAWAFMDSLAVAKSGTGPWKAAVRFHHTWVLSFLYIGTFGSFIGFSFALPLVIKYSFPTFLTQHPFIGNYLGGLGFSGALLGSLARPGGGWLADRLGGARVTLASFVGMAAFTVLAIIGVSWHTFTLFFLAFSAIFVLSGIGNGSTYKMITASFKTRHGGDSPAEAKRQAAAALGIAGAVGALGGVGVQTVLRQASLGISALEKEAQSPAQKAAIAVAHASWSLPALVAFLGSYVIFAVVCSAVYLRSPAPTAATAGSPLSSARQTGL